MIYYEILVCFCSDIWLIIGLAVNMLPYTEEVQSVFKLCLNSFGVVHQTEFQ